MSPSVQLFKLTILNPLSEGFLSQVSEGYLQTDGCNVRNERVKIFKWSTVVRKNNFVPFLENPPINCKCNLAQLFQNDGKSYH